MIRVVGPTVGQEYQAAMELREQIVRAWPTAVDDQHMDIRLIASAKCHGQGVQDIDLLVLADFGPGVSFRPIFPLTTRAGQIQHPESIEVRSLCVALEVKGHPPDRVKFIGTSTEVRYSEGWHNATEQSHKQIHAIKNYVENARIQPPWITGLIWLTGVPNTLLPAGTHNTVGQPLTWETLLSTVARLSPPRYINGRWVMDASPQGDRLALLKATDLFTKEIKPTRLDRKRVERIASDATELIPLIDALNKTLTIVRGRGGTGKTVRLLQLAHRLSQTQAARVLILTYNKALVADVRRLLTLMGISPTFTGQSVQIRTVHGFLSDALQSLEIVTEPDTHFAEAYEQAKNDALTYLREGAMNAQDIASLASQKSATFGWDYVLVDEGQDWPDNERELLFALFGTSRLVVADGVDQLVRATTATDWRGSLRPEDVTVVQLRRCLRMKAGLARFASAVSRNLGLLYSEWEPNEEVSGGRVVIVEGPYLQDRSLHDRFTKDNLADGNQPVDMLFCVPPSLVTHDSASGRKRSIAAAALERWGYAVWDGTEDDVREGYPTENKQFRIVQYDSCRGLEGWIVVNLALDRFFEHKRALATSMTDVDPDLEAARWLGIPLSRAIDTLVIQLDVPESPVARAMRNAARECPDIVEYIDSRSRDES